MNDSYDLSLMCCFLDHLGRTTSQIRRHKGREVEKYPTENRRQNHSKSLARLQNATNVEETKEKEEISSGEIKVESDQPFLP